MKLYVKKLHEKAIIPEYIYKGDVGFDLSSIQKQFIVPRQLKMIRTGIAVRIPEGYEMTVRQRSGLSKLFPNYIAIGIGTIDRGYTGEIMIPIINNTRYENLTIEIGDRIAQGIISPVLNPEIIEVEELTPTERGSNGFGSTGI